MNDPLGLFDTEQSGPDPLGLFDDKPKTSFGDDLKIGLAGVGNTVDRAWSGLAGGLAGQFSTDEADSVFNGMEDRIKSRNQWANPDN